MKLFLYPNIFNPEQKEQAVNCIKELTSQGHSVSLSPEKSDILFGNDRHNTFPASESDLIVSLGGDGAVLRAAQLAIQEKKPLIGINGGHLGFLCALPYTEIADFSRTLSQAVLSERQLIEFTCAGENHIAVNDVIFAKKSFGSSVNLSLSIEGLGGYQMRGDGLVVATPTGSTAYNYSAGGPVIDPRCASLVITPLCAHNHNLRPLVIDNSHSVTISENNDAALILCDGHEIGTIQGEICLRKSERTLSLYTKNDLIQKLG